jgi:hypothetical protein
MAVYGSNATSNRVLPGGNLGSNQYYYTTNKKTGEISVNRYVRENIGGNDFRNIETEVGSIPKGGTFTPNSNTSSAEKSFYGTKSNVSKVRTQALQTARKEWDGKTQPPPNSLIYGEKSLNAAYDPAGAGNADTSLKNIGKAGLQGGLNALMGGGDLEDIVKGAVGSAIGSIFGGGGGGDLLVYPTALRQSDQDYISFECVEWAATGEGRGGYSWKGRPANRTTIGSVYLPVPGGISDTNAVSWGGDKMDPKDTALANLALTGIESSDPFKSMADEANAMIKATQGDGGADIKDALSKGIAGMASGTGAQLLTRTTGNIMNPNMELLFKDPSLRPFNFTWKFAPRSSKEAEEVIKIIRFFKKNMAPTKSKSSLFLESPNTWFIKYKHRGQDHKFLNKFKECAMTSFTTQYTPDGNYATFEDGVMTAYSVTMALQELDPVFSNDYENVDGIGY